MTGAPRSPVRRSWCDAATRCASIGFFTTATIHSSSGPAPHCREMTREEARSATYSFLDDALHPTERRTSPRSISTRNRVGHVIDALSAEAQLPGDVQAPAWLMTDADRPPARELLACDDSGYCTCQRAGYFPARGPFFGVNALPYAFDPGSPEPVEWLRVPGSVRPDDQDVHRDPARAIRAATDGGN